MTISRPLSATSPKSGDLCELTTAFGVPAARHYRCDEFPDGTVTRVSDDAANGAVLVAAPEGAPWGFTDADRAVKVS